jgi:hypothetical protein
MLQSQTNVSVCVLVVPSLVSPELNLHEHGYPIRQSSWPLCCQLIFPCVFLSYPAFDYNQIFNLSAIFFQLCHWVKYSSYLWIDEYSIHMAWRQTDDDYCFGMAPMAVWGMKQSVQRTAARMMAFVPTAWLEPKGQTFLHCVYFLLVLLWTTWHSSSSYLHSSCVVAWICWIASGKKSTH